MDDDQTLVYCKVEVDPLMGVTARYKYDGNDIEGKDRFNDEDYSDWSDDDIKNLVCDMLGISEEDADKIELTWI